MSFTFCLRITSWFKRQPPLKMSHSDAQPPPGGGTRSFLSFPWEKALGLMPDNLAVPPWACPLWASVSSSVKWG